jgi:excisionase family DNA binding protein
LLPESALSTPREAAEYLKIRESTVNGLARRGELPCVWLGDKRLRRFRIADLDAFVMSRCSASPTTSNGAVISGAATKNLPAVSATDHAHYRAA